MNKSDSIKDLAAALSKCQHDLKDVFKGTQGYGYKYASLDKVYDEVRPKMVAFNLSLTHQKSYNKETHCIELVSLLMHDSGEWIEYFGSLPFQEGPKKNNYQDAGSGFTYLERYQTSAIFAITADEDNDGDNNGGKGNKTPPPVKKSDTDYIVIIDKLDTADAVDAWLKANGAEVKANLSEQDINKFRSYAEQIKAVLNGK